MKSINFLIFTLLVILFSCDDKEDNSGLSIGDDTHVVIQKLDPPLTIINPGSDSIDLDGDSNYDLVFIKSPEALLTGFAIKTELIKRSGIQICLSRLNNYPDTLTSSAILNDKANWSVTTEKEFILQSYDCHDGNNCLPIGNFTNTKPLYLGLKVGNRFGWVKMVNEVFGPLKIEEYALMK